MGFPFERVIEWRPDFPNDSGGCNLISRAFSLNKFVQSGGDKLVPEINVKRKTNETA